MADFSTIINSVGSGAGTTVTWVLIVVGVAVALLFLGGGGFLYWWNVKRYNLRVEIKMTRSDGKISLGEWGRGMFNSKQGVLYIKRPKMSRVPMQLVDIRRYLQGSDLITVIQVGPEDYRPVINDSWTEHIVEFEDDKGNIIEQKESVLNIKADTGHNKPWKSAFESASKKAYSLTNLLQQYATPISIAIVIIAVFVGFAIIWTRLPSVCK